MGLITRGYPTGLAPDNQIIISTSITIYDGQGNAIGYIESLNPGSNRPVTLAYHLNGADAGRPVESVPGIEKFSLSASGFALYDLSSINRGGLINRIAGSGAASFVVLANQQVPFNIKQVETHPANAALTRTSRYLGCMLTRLSRPVSIGTAMVMESVDFSVMYQE